MISRNIVIILYGYETRHKANITISSYFFQMSYRPFITAPIPLYRFDIIYLSDSYENSSSVIFCSEDSIAPISKLVIVQIVSKYQRNLYLSMAQTFVMLNKFKLSDFKFNDYWY